MSNKYIFTSRRLGFRGWEESDLDAFLEVSGDPEVMEFFPNLATKESGLDFIKWSKECYEKHGYCYYAAEELASGKVIGFIGIHWQTFEADFTPCTDIGWRLNKKYWNKGYATEGAKRCLEYAFDELNLKKIYSMASLGNVKSFNVMKKIGMKKVDSFFHPALKNRPDLAECDLYLIEARG